jgi:Zn-dependent protease with chaperone function
VTSVAHHAAALLVAAGIVLWLRAGRWTHACPRTALVLWQVVSVTVVASVIGTLLGLGLGPYEKGTLPALGEFLADSATGPAWQRLGPGHLAAVATGLALTVWLVCTQIAGVLALARTRARHRLLLRLVARREPDVLVVDHPVAVAYCLPGRRPQIVVSAGARKLLTARQFDAVLAHERAHAVERHHLVLAPFHALCRVLPRSRALVGAWTDIELLVEMRADDRAAHQHGSEALATALERFHASGSAGVPAGALAAGADHVQARIQRLRAPRRASLASRVVAVLAAALALSTSLSLFVLPF